MLTNQLQPQPYDLPQYDAYRTSARVPEPTIFPPPSARTLLRPFALATLFVVFVLGGPIVFSLLAPSVLDLSRDVRLVPWVDSTLDAFAIAAVASFAVLIFDIAWRVRPSWRAFSWLQKFLYIGALLSAQAIVVGSFEIVFLISRGGVPLFAPVLGATATAPDGQTAYVYENCFLWCTTQVFVAQPHELTMKRQPEFSVRTDDITKRMEVEWLEDGTVRVVYRRREETK
jgi:hypothetical protein